ERGPPQSGGGDRTMARTAGRGAPAQHDGGQEARAARGRPARVYKLVDGKPVPVNLRVGISDGQRTAVIDGALAEGDPVIVAEGGAERPGAPRPPGGRRVF
ncbi:MAG TPA: hypothetical protein VFE76_00545, partial [Myxococcales bacterium]|nr:hypothetical protein [Myxococcales bacterium]